MFFQVVIPREMFDVSTMMLKSVTNENTSGRAIGDPCLKILSEGPPPASMFPFGARIALCVIMGLVTVVAILDNSLVIITVYVNRTRATKTNILVVSLAVADLLIALGPMPMSIYLMSTSITWPIGDFLCSLLNSFDAYLCTLSIFHVSFMAIDRFISIIYPFLYQRVGRKSVTVMLTTSWVAPLAFSFLPIMTQIYRIGLEEWYACALPLGSKMGHCNFFANKVYSVTIFTSFVICLCIITFCYLKIYSEARRQAVQIRTLSICDGGSENVVKQELKAAKTIGIILVAFTACWLPSEIVSVVNPFIDYRISDNIYDLMMWLGYINSMLNPLIYFFSNSSYKQQAKTILMRLTSNNTRADVLSLTNLRHDTIRQV